MSDVLPDCPTCGGTRNVWKDPSNRASTTVVGLNRHEPSLKEGL